ncbi:hypothetical protein [Janthinobacterium sp. CG3]|uniref:hypothetical protein n=1 Tax=Janthinobacterium sp. CG3 TaxID=1075768 RepID=UPI0012F9D654|nr:hypothetical protein [Janthinobacterium sp. CG3]
MAGFDHLHCLHDVKRQAIVAAATAHNDQKLNISYTEAIMERKRRARGRPKGGGKSKNPQMSEYSAILKKNIECFAKNQMTV